MQRALVIATDRHTLGHRAVSGGAERPAEAAFGAVGDDDEVAAQLIGLAGRLVLDGGAHQLAALEDRADRLGALVHHRSGGDGVVGDEGVQIAALHDVAVVGVDRVVGPRQLHRAAVGDGAKARVLMEPLQLIAQAHVLKLGDSAGGQPITTCLVARENTLFDDGDVDAGLGQPVAGRGAGWSAPNDEHLVSTSTFGWDAIGLSGRTGDRGHRSGRVGGDVGWGERGGHRSSPGMGDPSACLAVEAGRGHSGRSPLLKAVR